MVYIVYYRQVKGGGILYRESDLTKEIYRPSEVAKLIGVTYKTVQLWDFEGKINFSRTVDSNRRFMTKDQLREELKARGLYKDEDLTKRDIVYARVSSNKQKQRGDLDRQAMYIIENVGNLQNPKIIKEVGSGLNDKRKGLLDLIKDVHEGKVRNVYITYKDRLTRFGYNYLEEFFKLNNVNIKVVKDVDQEKSVEEELVDDVLSLVTSFSGKLYGLRSGKNKKVDKNNKEISSIYDLIELLGEDKVEELFNDYFENIKGKEVHNKGDNKLDNIME